MTRKQYVKHHNNKAKNLQSIIEEEINNFLCCMKNPEEKEPAVEFEIPAELHSYLNREKMEDIKTKIEARLQQRDMRIYFRNKIKKQLESNPQMQPYLE